MSDEIFREVDEDLQRERYMRLWQRYGRYVAGAALAAVLATAAWVGWQSYDLSRRQALSDRYATAAALAAEGEVAGSINAFAELAGDTSTGYRVLARLRQAALLRRNGDAVGALAVYDAAAADGGAPQTLRDLATILGALHGLDLRDNSEVTRRLDPLAADDSPWRFSARELLALVALRAGDQARARELLQALADDLSAPQGLRARAAELLAALRG